MELLSTSTAFASVISLFGQFISERGASKTQNSDDFMLWLTENHHEEVKSLLELNTNTTINIKALLAENHDELKTKLEALDKALIMYASSLSGFSGLAFNIYPDSLFSEQAISILRQLDESGGSKVLEIKNRGVTLHILDVPGQVKINLSEQRYILEDLNVLVKYGMLIHSHNDSGQNIYSLTRAASNLVSPLN